MRRTLILLGSVAMLASLTGCHTVTGTCDCVDLPPPVVSPNVPHASGPISSAPGMALPMPTGETIKAMPMTTPTANPELIKVPETN